MNTKNIRRIIYHVSIYLGISSLSIIVQLVESTKSFSFSPQTSSTRDKDSDRTLLRHTSNGQFHNLTFHESQMSSDPMHKLPPPSLVSLQNMKSMDSVSAMFPINGLELDIKEVILTNLDVDKPGPVIVNNHAEYSRENDRFEFTNRYLIDDDSAIGNKK